MNKKDNQPLVSIVIRTKNEEKNIRKILEAIFSQQLVSFEIIVVDSCSTDNTQKLVKEYGIRLIPINPEQFTFGRAINIGAKESQGEYIAILSADVIPVNSLYLYNLIKNFNDLRVAGVYSKQIPFPKTNPIEVRDYLNGYGNRKKIQTTDCFFSNASSAIRKNIWKKIPFDETLPGTEDGDWANKVQKQGYHIVYEPDSAVYHSHNENLVQIYRRAKRESIVTKQIFPTVKADWKQSYQEWKNAVKSDWEYLIKTNTGFYWLIYSPFNRLAKILGRYVGLRNLL